VTEKIVVGLFETRGIAEDAAHRLMTDGTPAKDIALYVLHDVAPLPAHVEAGLAALELDPLLLGDVRKTFAPYIHNGETTLFVRTMTEAEIDDAVDTMKQYAPVRIMVTTPDAAAQGPVLG
jgi:hypothetical protein